jgi:hypothetical protein
MGHRFKSRTLIGVCCAAVVAAGVSSCSSSGSGDSPSTPATSAAASASPSASGEQAAVLGVWQGYVKTLAAMYNQAVPLSAWNNYAALSAAQQATSDVATYRQQGIIVPGAPKVSAVQLGTVESSASPPTASLTACWDTRGFQPVYRSSGKSALAPGESPAPPHIADVGFQKFSYGWRVTTFTVSGTSC